VGQRAAGAFGNEPARARHIGRAVHARLFQPGREALARESGGDILDVPLTRGRGGISTVSASVTSCAATSVHTSIAINCQPSGGPASRGSCGREEWVRKRRGVVMIWGVP
jgi:hypothetical protein